MLNPDKVQATLSLLGEVYPKTTAKYIVDLVDNKCIGYFNVMCPETINVHLRFLTQLQKIWESTDVAVVYDGEDILFFPHEVENLQ